MLKIALIYILATSLALVQSSRKEVAVIIGGYQGEAEARVSAQGAAAAPEEELGVLYCTVLYCTVLYCTVLHCTVL